MNLTHGILDQGKGKWISRQATQQQTELKVRDIIIEYLEKAEDQEHLEIVVMSDQLDQSQIPSS